jgi:hypothetical protein
VVHAEFHLPHHRSRLDDCFSDYPDGQGVAGRTRINHLKKRRKDYEKEIEFFVHHDAYVDSDRVCKALLGNEGVCEILSA